MGIEYTFLADANIGKLARLLRMLGFDTVYNNTFSVQQLKGIVQRENRVLLSRNPAADRLFPEIKSFIVNDENPYNQLRQVVQHFDLKEKLRPFTRCIVCNGILLTVSKENIISRLEQNTALYYDNFWQCNDCGRIYWKGSHYERMLQLVAYISKAD